MYTWSGCACKKTWEYDDQQCTNYCCVPDQDPFGDWCMVDDTECEGTDWGYCQPKDQATPGCFNDPPNWKDSEDDGCYTYAVAKWCDVTNTYGPGWSDQWGTFEDYPGTGGKPANKACCACGGGTTDPQKGSNCTDVAGWHDTDGDTCNIYANALWCTETGDYGVNWHEEWGTFASFAVDGISAPQACCACGYGSVGGRPPAPAPQAGPASVTGIWSLNSGDCHFDPDGCLTSPNFPQLYSVDSSCSIQMAEGNSKKVYAVEFRTEANYDWLTVNGKQYSGLDGPLGVVATGAITWTSDYDEVASGWKLCPEGVNVEAIQAALARSGSSDTGFAKTAAGNSFGMTVFGLVVIAIVVTVACCWYRRKKASATGFPRPGGVPPGKKYQTMGDEF